MSFRIGEAECVVEHDGIIAYRVTGKVVPGRTVILRAEDYGRRAARQRSGGGAK
jgi:hypothetical protein